MSEGKGGAADQKKHILRNEIQQEIRCVISLWRARNGIERDEQQRETGGKLPDPVEFEAAILGDCGERLVDDEPGGDDWERVAMKSISGGTRRGEGSSHCGPDTGGSCREREL